LKKSIKKDLRQENFKEKQINLIDSFLELSNEELDEQNELNIETFNQFMENKN